MLADFPLTEVRLLPGPFRHAQEMDLRYLLSLDPDRLLRNFRVNAGLPTDARPYGGWEAPTCELRGHIVGHYLSACSMMYASTGNPELKRRIGYMVAALARCQAALSEHGSHPGYLSAFPESFFDRVDERKPVWAPWYTMHKIMAGLLEAYQDGGDPQALDVLNRLAAWVKFRVDRLSTAQFQASLDTEQGGMNEVLANLAAVTGNADDLRLAQAFNHQAVFVPLERREDELTGLHGNTQIPKIIGAAREYELTGDPAYRTVADFFWHCVALDRSWVTGGDTDEEHFFAVGTESEHLNQTTAETCNTYNMLKLTRHLFAWDASAGTMDFYERALYNHILASQDPDTGMMIYFLSLEPGFHKLYCTPDQTFWCCTGTGMENHSKYGDTIFFHGADALYVNLFIPAVLRWPEQGLVVTQTTRFPGDGEDDLSLRLGAPRRLALKIRWPAWSATAAFAVNGRAAPVAGGHPGSYVTLEREWRDGDRVSARFQLRLHTEPMRGDASQVALLYGPIVLAGELGRDGLQGRPTEYAGAWPEARVPEAIPLVPGLVATPADLLRHVEPVAGPNAKPLTFRTAGIGRPHDVTLEPLYRIVNQRYTVYWQLYDEAGWRAHFAGAEPRELAREAAERRLVDQVWAGDSDSEFEHALDAGSSEIEESDDVMYRAAAHGSFGWTLKAVPGVPLVLKVGYAGLATAPFEVRVNGRPVAVQALQAHQQKWWKAVPVTETYPVPASLVGSADTLTVEFAGVGTDPTGPVIFCELSRPAPQT